MYIVIVGGGKIGYPLTRALMDMDHEVILLEKDPRRGAALAEELGTSLLQGDGCEVSVLERAGVGRADMFIAVTGDDEDNLVACQVAKARYKVPRTVALVNDPRNDALFRKLGIDVTINRTELVLHRVQEQLAGHAPIRLLTLKELDMELVSIRIPSDASTLGKRIGDIPLPPDCLISLIISKDKGPLVPSDDALLRAEDEVLVVARHADEKEVYSLLTGASLK